MRLLLLAFLLFACLPGTAGAGENLLVHCILWDRAKVESREGNYLKPDTGKHALFVVSEGGKVVKALIFGKRAAVLPLFESNEVWIAEAGDENSTKLIKASLPGLKKEQEIQVPHQLFNQSSVYNLWIKRSILTKLNDFLLFRAITGPGAGSELAISVDLKTGKAESFLPPISLDFERKDFNGECLANFFSSGNQGILVYPMGTGYFLSERAGRVEAVRFPENVKASLGLPYGAADFYSWMSQSTDSPVFLAIKTSNNHRDYYSVRTLNFSTGDSSELMTIPAGEADPWVWSWDANSMIAALGVLKVEGTDTRALLAKCSLTILNLNERKAVRTLEMLNLGAVTVHDQSVFYGESDRLMVVKGNLPPKEIARFPGRIAEIFPFPAVKGR